MKKLQKWGPRTARRGPPDYRCRKAREWSPRSTKRQGVLQQPPRDTEAWPAWSLSALSSHHEIHEVKDKDYVIKILFQGKPFLLIGSETDGAIATQEQWDNLEMSTAHMTDGVIHQNKKRIGTIDDITFLPDEEDQ